MRAYSSNQWSCYRANNTIWSTGFARNNYKILKTDSLWAHLAINMQVVLFDLEGTLVSADGPISVKELTNRTKQKLLELGIPRHILSKTDKATLMRNEATIYVEEFFKKNQRKLFQIEFDLFMKDYEIAAAQSSVLFNETLPVLHNLKKMGSIMAVVTNTCRKAVEIFFSKHQIGDFFQAVVTREDVKLLKPDPKGIQLALERLGRKDDFFFVGDSEFDVKATLKAKGIAILVRRKFSNKPEKLPNYVVRSLLEVPIILKREQAT